MSIGPSDPMHGLRVKREVLLAYETCQYTEYRLPKMLLIGAKVTSLDCPVVRNVRGAPAGLIHDAGSAAAALKLGISSGMLRMRGAFGPTVNCSVSPSLPKSPASTS